MNTLPPSPDLDQLKKQAKRLLRDARQADQAALARFAGSLPSARAIDLSTYELSLHDAQSVVAREYGFRSWPELKRYVEWKRADTSERLARWTGWCLDGGARERRLALRMLEEEPELFDRDPWFACLTGNAARLTDAVASDRDFATKAGGPVAMLPLVAVTHSRLILELGEGGFVACARVLLAHGADVNSSWRDPLYPEHPLSVLYGAAGKSHDVALTKLLLDAGANPDDNESLYHAVESGDPACAELLLQASARVSGTNVLGRVLDFDRLDLLRLLLAHGGDANERPWLHHAIQRGRSLAHVEALLQAGADPRARNEQGLSLYAYAGRFGRTDVLDLLRVLGVDEPEILVEDEFVAACSRADLAAASAMLEAEPDILGRLDKRQLQAMPALAAIGRSDAVRTMLAVGWPLEITTEWHATALNLAMFQGDSGLVTLLLDAGADWRTLHGFGDNVLGTLSFASQSEEIAEPAPRDFVECTRALIRHGVPREAFDRYSFSPEVADYLASVRQQQ